MTKNELNKYKTLLETKQAELAGGLRNREGIAIEKTADALDEVQLAGERELAIRNLDRESNLLRNVRYGGIFVIGTDNTIARNRLLNLNTAHCGCPFTPGEPGLFQSGVYLGKGAERPAAAHGNLVEGNEITGYQMAARCVGASPTVYPGWNTVRNNRCR